MSPLLWIGALVGLGYSVQAAIGFGAALIILTPGAHILPLPELIPITVPLGWSLSLFLAIRDWKRVQWHLLLTRILPLMGSGLLVGLYILDQQPGPWMKPAFGVFVVGISALELWKRRGGLEQAPGTSPWQVLWLPFAGLVHGLFTTGGPPLVYFASRRILQPGPFRATLSAVWVLMSSGVLVHYWQVGTLNASSLQRTAWLSPMLLIGLLVGDRLHRGLDAQRFILWVYRALLLTGLSLVVSALL